MSWSSSRVRLAYCAKRGERPSLSGEWGPGMGVAPWPAAGPAGDVLLLPRDRALPHRHGRLPQRGNIHHSFLPLLEKHPPIGPPCPPPLHRRPSGGPAGPSPNTVSRTPEYHLGPVALSPVDTADFQSSMLRRTDINPQLASARWPKGEAAHAVPSSVIWERVGTLKAHEHSRCLDGDHEHDVVAVVR